MQGAGVFAGQHLLRRRRVADAAAAAACEDALGYCDPAAVEAARDEDVDRQLEAILERGRRSPRQKKRR